MKKKAVTPKPEMVLNIILDESGSMSSVREKTVEGLNEYLGGLVDDPNADYLATLTKFDAYPGDPTCRIQYKLKKLKDIGPMELDHFNPRGSTPLMDAVGITVREVEKECGDRPVLTVIVTDGYENASREFTNETVKKLIQEKQATGKWTFVYLGADQNAWANSSAMGIPLGNSISYSSANTQKAYAAMASVTMARSYNNIMGASATVNCFADAGLSNVSLEDNLNPRKPSKTTPASWAAVRNSASSRARVGGVARAQSQTTDQRRELALKAAKARWNK